MIELLPQEKSRLRYLRLFEEQVLWNAKKQEPKTFLNKLTKWMSVK